MVLGFWSALPLLHLARPLSHTLPIAGRLLPRVALRSIVPSLSACHTTFAACAPNVSNSSLLISSLFPCCWPTGRNAVRGEKEGSVWKVYGNLVGLRKHSSTCEGSLRVYVVACRFCVLPVSTFPPLLSTHSFLLMLLLTNPLTRPHPLPTNSHTELASFKEARPCA